MNGSGARADQAAVQVLDRRYRWWLRVYPQRLRQDRGAELLDTLLELSRPGQRRPAPEQVAAVLRAGLRARSGTDGALTPGQVWHAAVPLAGVLLLVQAAVQGLVGGIDMFAVGSSGATHTHDLGREWLIIAWGLLPLLPLMAVCLRRYRVAVALALLSPVVVLASLAIGTSTMSAASILGALADACAPAVLLLPWLLRRPEPGPRRWQIGVPAVCIALPALADAAWMLAGTPWTPWFTVVPAGSALLALVLVLTWGALIDARVALATGVLLLWTVLSHAGTQASHAAVDWLALLVTSAIGLAALASGLWTADRQRAC